MKRRRSWKHVRLWSEAIKKEREEIRKRTMQALARLKRRGGAQLAQTHEKDKGPLCNYNRDYLHELQCRFKTERANESNTLSTF